MSHFHFDHNQNIANRSRGLYRIGVFSGGRILGGGMILGYRISVWQLSSVQVNEWWPLDTDIDLGGNEVVSIPGHTDESAMIGTQNKLMFMGIIYMTAFDFLGQQN